MNTPGQTEAFLVLRAQAGDVEAFGKLYELVGPSLWRYISYVVGDRGAAEDVLQSVFLTVHRKIAWLKDPASFRPWLYRIAWRHAVRASKQREVQLTDVEWDQMRSHAASSPDRDSLLESARQRIAQLPPASRAVLSLHYVEGMRLEEAAAVLKIPVGTAKSRLHFGIARLRAWLGAGG